MRQTRTARRPTWFTSRSQCFRLRKQCVRPRKQGVRVRIPTRAPEALGRPTRFPTRAPERSVGRPGHPAHADSAGGPRHYCHGGVCGDDHHAHDTRRQSSKPRFHGVGGGGALGRVGVRVTRSEPLGGGFIIWQRWVYYTRLRGRLLLYTVWQTAGHRARV